MFPKKRWMSGIVIFVFACLVSSIFWPGSQVQAKSIGMRQSNATITGKWISPQNAFITQNGGEVHMRASADSSDPNDPVTGVDFVAWWPGQPGDAQHPSTVICPNTPVVIGTTDQHICDWGIGNMPIGILWLGFKVHDQAGNTTSYPGGLLWGTITQTVDAANQALYAGYGISGTQAEKFQYFDIKGSFNVNKITCNSLFATAHVAYWVGLGGPNYTSPTIKQTGVASECNGGQISYYAWYEVLPADPVRLDDKKYNGKYPVVPGDTITAEVKYQGSHQYLILLNDSRWQKPFSQTVSESTGPSATPDPAGREIAEWLVENPPNPTSLLPEFGTGQLSICIFSFREMHSP